MKKALILIGQPATGKSQTAQKIKGKFPDVQIIEGEGELMRVELQPRLVLTLQLGASNFRNNHNFLRDKGYDVLHMWTFEAPLEEIQQMALAFFAEA